MRTLTRTSASGHGRAFPAGASIRTLPPSGLAESPVTRGSSRPAVSWRPSLYGPLGEAAAPVHPRSQPPRGRLLHTPRITERSRGDRPLWTGRSRGADFPGHSSRPHSRGCSPVHTHTGRWDCAASLATYPSTPSCRAAYRPRARGVKGDFLLRSSGRLSFVLDQSGSGWMGRSEHGSESS